MPTISRALAAPEKRFQTRLHGAQGYHRRVEARPSRSGLGAGAEPDDICVRHDDGPAPVGALQIWSGALVPLQLRGLLAEQKRSLLLGRGLGRLERVRHLSAL